jgi:hypothetical protein
VSGTRYSVSGTCNSAKRGSILGARHGQELRLTIVLSGYNTKTR